MSPDSQNYKFADVAKMNAVIAKESERLRNAHMQKYQSRSDMPPPQAIPVSVSALKDRTNGENEEERASITKSFRQHAERSNFFKLVTAKVAARQQNEYTQQFKKPPVYGFAIDDAFPDEHDDIVVLGRVDYDKYQAQ